MLLCHPMFFRCPKQSLPEELSSCLNTKSEILRTKPDVCRAGLLSSQSAQVGTGDLKILSEPRGGCNQPKSDPEQEGRLQSAPQPPPGLPKECSPTEASPRAELETSSTPELQKHLEHAPSTSDVFSEKPEVNTGVNSDSSHSCAGKMVEPSALGCQSQSSKETSGKVDNESCCTRSNNKIQSGECF